MKQVNTLFAIFGIFFLITVDSAVAQVGVSGTQPGTVGYVCADLSTGESIFGYERLSENADRSTFNGEIGVFSTGTKVELDLDVQPERGHLIRIHSLKLEFRPSGAPHPASSTISDIYSNIFHGIQQSTKLQNPNTEIECLIYPQP